MEGQIQQKIERYALMLCMFVLGIGGIVGGGAFMIDSSGDLLGMSQSYLADAPVATYFWPGVFLFAAFGLVPLGVAYALWRKPALGDKTTSYLFHEHWSWNAAVGVSVLLLVWMAVELYFVGYIAPIQIATSLLGLVILGLVLLPPVRTYYADTI